MYHNQSTVYTTVNGAAGALQDALEEGATYRQAPRDAIRAALYLQMTVYFLDSLDLSRDIID